MAKIVVPIDRFSGISYSEKEGPTSSYLFGRSVDYRTDHKKLTLLPRTIKESGTVVTDLPMVADQQGSDAYIYGDVGNIYKRTSGRTYSLEHTASNSTGNGIKYYGEDSYLYYTQDTTIGRCGPFWGTSTWVDGFLEAQGGIPLNTACMDFEASSSQYATAADSASLSITGDISIEAYVKAESLPSAGSTRMIVSKWDENSDERSYYLGISAVSGYFGDGGDGALTVSVNTTQAPTDSACTGAATSYSLSATNASFAATKKILIHQTRGTGAGKWERNEITSYTAGTITTVDPLKNTYTSGAQIIQLPEYTNVTVNTGITWTAKAWNGTVGGILAFLANGTITVTGAIIATGKGFRKGAGGSVQHDPGEQAEGTSGAGGTNSKYANGNGGGGGDEIHDNWEGGGGGGGGHTNAGSWGLDNGGDEKGRGGGSVGSADLTTLVFGGGGGGGAASHQEAAAGGDGGNGGGIVFMVGTTITITGSVVSGGSNGSNGAGTAGAAGGGGGAGGSILLKAQTATLGATKITASAGSGGIGTSGITRCDGGAGSVGRIHLDYYSSYSGTTTPTLDVIQDNNLVTNTTYRVVLGLSDDGSTVETLVMNLDSMNTDTWYRFQVAWDASASTAYFYRNGSSLGTSTGAMTAIYDSTALLGLAASFDSSSDDENHWDGKIDDVRIFNDVRTAGEFLTYKNVEIGEVQGLQAYYQLDSTETDSSANSNTLTLENAPTYDTTDVPFASPTTRAELDQSLDTSGNTYTLTTAINEGATHRQSFVPAKDPQKSIEVLVAAAGTGDWTITVHDAQNREIATLDVDNAELAAGDYEFIFASAWRPVVGATYHFHLTSTVADGTVTTTDAADLETVDFHTYYQVLVDDPYHPIEQVTNILAIGNERYLATWDGVTYNPHRLVFPSGYRVRCLGIWREYLVIGTSRGTNIDDFDQGRLFFWDGVSDTYNFSSPVPQGGVNAIMKIGRAHV